MKKRVLLIFLASVLVFGMMPASVATAITKDAQACADLGVLKGEDDGVTDAYLAQTTERYQLVVIMARLMGKESQIIEADPGAASFIDAEGQSEYVRKVMVFAKNNPQLGFIGFEDGSFKPLETATAQQLYKVFLVILGYVEGADFTWSQVFSKSMSSGLTRLANLGAITNADLATGLIEILRSTMADDSGTLATSLIGKELLDSATVSSSGILEPDYFVPDTTDTTTDQATTEQTTPPKQGGGSSSGGVFTGGGNPSVALNTLNSAIATAEALLNSTWISVDGKDVPMNGFYASTAAWTSYDVAVTAAKSVAKGAGGSYSVYNNAVNALAAATASFNAARKVSASGFDITSSGAIKSAVESMVASAKELMWSTRPSETGKLVFDDQYWIEPELLYWLADCYSEGYDLIAGWANPEYTQDDRIDIYYDLVRSTAVIKYCRSEGIDVVPHAIAPYTPAPPIVTLQPKGIPTPSPERTETVTFSAPTATFGAVTLKLSYSSEFHNGSNAIPISVGFTTSAGLNAASVAVKVADALTASTTFAAIGWNVSTSGGAVMLTWNYPGNRGAQDRVVLEVVDGGGTGIGIVSRTARFAEHPVIWKDGGEGVLTINRPMATNNTIWVGEYRFGGKRYTFGSTPGPNTITGADEFAQADALFTLLTNGENKALDGFNLAHVPGSNVITFTAKKTGEHPPWFIYTIRNFSTFSSFERGDKQRPLMSWPLFPRIDLEVSRYWFEVHRLPNNVYAFFEPGDNDQEVISYLIIGDGKAMLLDTGEGIGNLKKAVEELIVAENLDFTINDVFVAITHGHSDHIGDVGQFDGKKIYCHPNVVTSVQNGVTKTTGGNTYGWDVPGGQARLTLPGAAVTHPVTEGAIIDIGGRKLDVIVTPDHTIDSVTLIDKEYGIIFTGDWYYPAWGSTGSSCGYIYEAEYTRVYDLLGKMIKDGEVGRDVKDFWIFGAHNEVMYGRQIFKDNAIAWRYTIDGEGPKYAIGSPRSYRFFNGGISYGPRNSTSTQFPGNTPAGHALGGCVRCAAYFS